jgi:hypothetical protein
MTRPSLDNNLYGRIIEWRGFARSFWQIFLPFFGYRATSLCPLLRLRDIISRVMVTSGKSESGSLRRLRVFQSWEGTRAFAGPGHSIGWLDAHERGMERVDGGQ